MKASRNGVLWVALAALIAIGTIVPGLQAGPFGEGRFKLPFDAQVGKMTLSTGDYTFSVIVTPGRTTDPRLPRNRRRWDYGSAGT